jgi:hypothetical protein
VQHNQRAREAATRFRKLTLLAMILAALAACGTRGSAEGGATDDGAHGRVKIGIPF